MPMILQFSKCMRLINISFQTWSIIIMHIIVNQYVYFSETFHCFSWYKPKISWFYFYTPHSYFPASMLSNNSLKKFRILASLGLLWPFTIVLSSKTRIKVTNQSQLQTLSIIRQSTLRNCGDWNQDFNTYMEISMSFKAYL